MDYNTAVKIYNNIRPYFKHLYISGSIRRKERIVNDLDIITREHLAYILDKLIEEGFTLDVIKGGDKYMRILLYAKIDGHNYKVPIDFWRARSDYEYFFKKLMHDMEKGRAIGWKNKARKAGYELSDTGLRQNGILVDVSTRKQLRKMIDKPIETSEDDYISI